MTRPKTKILVDGGDPQETRQVRELLGFVDGARPKTLRRICRSSSNVAIKSRMRVIYNLRLFENLGPLPKQTSSS